MAYHISRWSGDLGSWSYTCRILPLIPAKHTALIYTSVLKSSVTARGAAPFDVDVQSPPRSPGMGPSNSAVTNKEADGPGGRLRPLIRSLIPGVWNAQNTYCLSSVPKAKLWECEEHEAWEWAGELSCRHYPTTGNSRTALRVTPAQKLIYCPCLGVPTPQVPNCIIFTKYRAIIYNTCLLLVLYPNVLSCFGFMECKQIQIQQWSLLGAMDPIKYSCNCLHFYTMSPSQFYRARWLSRKEILCPL
jgi:hypothetical protein